MNKPVILCVDDEQMVLSSLKQQLKRHFENKYAIETVDNGEEGLELVIELTVDNVDLPLVISDQIMPGMKGDEFLKRVHDISPRTLNILLTGQASTEAVGNAVNYAKLYRYIAKPWDQSDLLMTAAEAVRSYFQDKKLCEQNVMLQQMNENLAELNQELQKRLDIFHKFVPNQFLRVLNITEYDAIDRGRCIERDMSVMFTDIRDFTRLSENLQLHENFNFINSYYAHVCPVISNCKGFIDKYIGDAIMALFENADDAVCSVIEMMLALAKYNQQRQTEGLPAVRIGVGINTGKLIMGTVGDEERIQTTVIGDMVNVAARVESLTKHYEVPILITDHTRRNLRHEGRYLLRFLESVVVRGKQQPVTLYEVVDTIPPKLNTPKNAIIETFNQAIKHYQEGAWQAAERLFQACLACYPDDKPTQLFLERLHGDYHSPQI